MLKPQSRAGFIIKEYRRSFNLVAAVVKAPAVRVYRDPLCGICGPCAGKGGFIP